MDDYDGADRRREAGGWFIASPMRCFSGRTIIAGIRTWLM